MDKTEEQLNDEIKDLKEKLAANKKANEDAAKRRYAGAAASAAASALLADKKKATDTKEAEISDLKAKIKIERDGQHFNQAIVLKNKLYEKYKIHF